MSSRRKKAALDQEFHNGRLNVDEQYDVVVVGSGMAGCATAAASAKLKLKTLMLEKSDYLGGGTAISWGGLWVGNNHLALAMGLEDSLEQSKQYLRFIGGGATEEAHVEAYVNEAPVALKAFEDMGVRFQVTRKFPDHYFPAAPGSTVHGRHVEVVPTSADSLGPWKDKIRSNTLEPYCLTTEEIVAWGGVNNSTAWDHDEIATRNSRNTFARGRGLIAQMLGVALAQGVTVQTGEPVAELLRDGERIAGVVTKSGRKILASRGVVLATGGYEGDPALADCYEGLPGFCSPFPAGVEGDGMRMGTKAGGGVGLMRNNLSLFLGYTVPDRQGVDEYNFRFSSIAEMLLPHTILVNDQGRRFADETYFQDTAMALRQFDIWKRRFSNLPCFLIFDGQYVRNFSFCGRLPGTVPPDWVARGSTLAELAERLGVSAAGLEQTAERYNAMVEQGEDTDFRRGSKRWTLAGQDGIRAGRAENRTLGTIAQGPFYGLKLSPSSFASAGLKTSVNANVLALDGSSIRNLYAVGNAASHAEYGIGYQAGTSLGSAMTFGYLAAQALAAPTRND